MRKKLHVYGNNLALIITPAMLKQLNITKETPIKISIKKGSLIIEPDKKLPKKIVKKETTTDILEIGKKVMKQYDEVFKKLAKT